MATTKITNPELFDLGSLNTALQLPSGSTAQRPTSPSTGEWRYNTDNNLIEFYDGGSWRELQSEDIPPIPSEHFNTVTYTGNGTAQSITGVGFQPDFVWIKARNVTYDHALTDSTRGVTHPVYITTGAQLTNSTFITSFDADGFSIGNNAVVNNNTNTYVAWCWKLNGGTTSSNTDGSITSTVQANRKAGFSLIKYTGNGSAGATVGHGLGSIPELTIFKQLDSGGTSGGLWNTYLTSTNTVGFLNSSAAFVANTGGTNGTVDIANMSSTTFGFLNGSSSVNNQNNSGSDYIVYAFTSVAGYSKIGTYTGNGSSNGPIINTGFEPAFLMIKRTDTDPTAGAGGVWIMYDNKRNPSNPRNTRLWADNNAAEFSTSQYNIDFLSNGFQPRDGTAGYAMNTSGGNYLYIAFASDPSAAPVLADSFNTSLYTGNGGTQSITGLGFSPNLVWLKERGQAANHRWLDTVRGATKAISSSLTNAEFTDATGLTSFDTDGFTLGANVDYNNNGGTFVAWNWKANSIPTINTDGTIQSIVSANQAAGFSVVKYVGNGSSGSTIGHGLSSAPEVIIAKNLQNITAWGVYVKDNVGSSGNPASERLTLQTSDATTTTTAYWGGTDPTSSVFTVGTENAVNQSGYNTIAYCFTSIAGFSKMGSYAGDSTSGRLINTGFETNWVMIKTTNATSNWFVIDSARGGLNDLRANSSSAEQTRAAGLTFVSNGFEIDDTTLGFNSTGTNYIYMAFKENPGPVVPAGQMAYLVVAGGAGGGGTVFPNKGGGGGAGGLRTSFGSTSGGGASAESNITLASGTYTITVGAGGGAAANGAASTITGAGSVSTVGGGQGGAITVSGTAGGSGGGTGGNNGGSITGGAGTAGEGFAGGTTAGNAGYDGSGGGGAAQVGGNGGFRNSTGGVGGNGLAVSITGTSTYYAGGGGGGSDSSSTGGRPGGLGGGGAGGDLNVVGGNGTANLGAGAGAGGENAQPGSGGSGVVILRLRTSDYSGTTTGSPTVTTTGEETIITYTGSGTYVHS